MAYEFNPCPECVSPMACRDVGTCQIIARTLGIRTPKEPVMAKTQGTMTMAEQDDLKSATLYDAAIKMLGEAVLLAYNVSQAHGEPEPESFLDFVKAHFTEHNDIIGDIQRAADFILNGSYHG